MGMNRLVTPTAGNPPVCGTFTYGTFTIPGGSTVIPGFHIGYIPTGGGQEQSGFFKCEVPPVPEPMAPALAGLGGTAMAGLSMLRRKLKKS